jgi:hypothetical protein
MKSTVNGVQVRQAIKAVIATTQNRTAKQILTRALVLLDQEGYSVAASYLNHQAHRTGRAANRWHRIFISGLAVLCAVLWGAVILIMFQALKSFVGGV